MEDILIYDLKKARRAATFNPPPSAAKTKKPSTVHFEKKPSEKRKRRARSTTVDQDEKGGERSTRFSSRKNTVLNRLHVEDQLREHEKRRVRNCMTTCPVFFPISDRFIIIGITT